MKRQTIAPLGIILLVAFLLRFIGIQWALPHHFHTDEDVMVYCAERIRTAESIQAMTDDLVFFIYSPLPLYWGALSGFVIDRFHPIENADPRSRVLLYTASRSFSAITGALTCIVIYLLGASLGGRGLGLMSALILAFIPIHVRNSHFFTVDVPFTLFASLILLSAVSLWKAPTLRKAVWGGVAIGFTLLCKYTGAAFFPLLFSVQLFTINQLRRQGWSLRRIIAYLAIPPLVGAGVFFLLDPWIFVNFPRFQETYELLRSLNKGADKPLWTYQFMDQPRGVYWFTNLLPAAITIPVMAAAVWGMIELIRRKQSEWVPVALFGMWYFLAVGLSYMRYIRYTIPLAIPFSLCAAFGLLALKRALPPGKISRPIVYGIFILVIAFPGLRSMAYLRIFTTEDIRLTAGNFIQETYPESTCILTDNSAFRPPIGSELINQPMHTNLSFNEDRYATRYDRYTIKLLDVYGYLFDRNVPDDDKRNYITDRLADVDVIVFSEEAPVQYSHGFEQHPVMKDFYHRLFSGKSSFRLVSMFQKMPQFGPYRWDDSDVELTWRLFDHPASWVFERKKTGTDESGAHTEFDETSNHSWTSHEIAQSRKSS